jgi:3-mercaptopyruvate sulfurtransferase SseA
LIRPPTTTARSRASTSSGRCTRGERDRRPEVIAYCRIGERSSHSWFVLMELLVYDRVKNYDGSWTEDGSLVGAPVER